MRSHQEACGHSWRQSFWNGYIVCNNGASSPHLRKCLSEACGRPTPKGKTVIQNWAFCDKAQCFVINRTLHTNRNTLSLAIKPYGGSFTLWGCRFAVGPEKLVKGKVKVKAAKYRPVKGKPCCSLQENCGRWFIFQQENNLKQSPKLDRNVFKTIQNRYCPESKPQSIREPVVRLELLFTQSKHKTAWTICEWGCLDVQTWHWQRGLKATSAVRVPVTFVF